MIDLPFARQRPGKAGKSRGAWGRTAQVEGSGLVAVGIVAGEQVGPVERTQKCPQGYGTHIHAFAVAQGAGVAPDLDQRICSSRVQLS